MTVYAAIVGNHTARIALDEVRSLEAGDRQAVVDVSVRRRTHIVTVSSEVQARPTIIADRLDVGRQSGEQDARGAGGIKRYDVRLVAE